MLQHGDGAVSNATSWRLSMSMHFETLSNLNAFCFARFVFASVRIRLVSILLLVTLLSLLCRMLSLQPREMSRLPRRLPSRRDGFTPPSSNSSGNIVMPISVANESAVLKSFKDKAITQVCR